MCGEKTSEKQFQTHCNYPNIGTGFGNHQQTDLRVFFTHQGNRKIAAEGNENGSYHMGQVIIVGIAGQGVQNEDADTGYGKYRVADNGQLLVAVIRAPTVLGQQAYD